MKEPPNLLKKRQTIMKVSMKAGKRQPEKLLKKLEKKF